MRKKTSRQNIAALQYSKERDYWLNQLRGELIKSGFPSEEDIPVKREAVRSEYVFGISEDLGVLLLKMSGGSDQRLHMILTAGLVLLLNKYTGHQDIVIGTPIYRQDKSGEFINTVLPLRVTVDTRASFKDLILTTRQVIQGAIENQNYPHETLLYKLGVSEVENGNSVFDVSLVLNSIQDPAYLDHIRRGVSFNFSKQGTGIAGVVVYDGDRYLETEIAVISERLIKLLENALRDVNAALRDIAMLSESEILDVVEGFNQTDLALDRLMSYHGAFEDQVRRTPDKIAVVFNNTVLTYRQLNEHANRLAYHLKNNYSVHPGDIVCVLTERSERMVIAVLAILKAGAAFLPLEANRPKERILYVLRDAAVKVVLADQSTGQVLEDFWGEVFFLDRESDNLPLAGDNLNLSLSEAAYVIYTSGSTGEPKGVVVGHASFMNYLRWFILTHHISDTDSTLLFSSIAFDLSYTSLWSCLLAGGTLHLLNSFEFIDSDELLTALVTNGITYIKLTPSQFSMVVHDATFADRGDRLLIRLIVLGGEEIKVDDVERYLVHNPETQFVNHYGPTETTIGTITHAIAAERFADFKNRPTLGRPIGNARIYIVDQDMRPVPVGIAGEICVAGSGVSIGYLNRPDLTAEKFIDSPFVNGDRLYKTGDLGKWTGDGEVAFLGRKDSQMKIRGYRVELGEIENMLCRYPDVTGAVVVAKRYNDDKYLVAYLCCGEGEALEGIKRFLAERLPDYMIPAYFVLMESFPLTPNGKIDRKALPAHEDMVSGRTVKIGARNSVDEKLIVIWKSILHQEDIGINDNFFELGGHSLKAAVMMSRISRDFGIRIELRKLFAHPTIRELTEVIRSAAPTMFAGIEPVEERAYYDLSHAQKRLWILDQFAEEKLAYLIPAAFMLRSLNRSAFERAIEAVVSRHESLRTSFVVVEGEPKQKISDFESLKFGVHYTDARHEENSAQLVERMVREEAATPFNLEYAPLLRARLVEVADDQYLFLFTMHHVISDGWSKTVLLKEILALYNAFVNEMPNPLVPLGIHYKDYAKWQNDQLSGANLKRHQTYWFGRFSGEIPVLNFPLDSPRPAIKTYNGYRVMTSLDPDLTSGLKYLTKIANASFFMTLLATVKAFLYRYTGEQDIIVGTPIAGREHASLENQVGFYINMLALRTQFEGGRSFNSLLEHVKVTTLDAFEYQVYPFDRLVDELSLERDLSRLPLFDVMVALQNFETLSDNDNLHGVSIEPYAFDYATSKYDLSFYFEEDGNVLNFHLEYNSDLFTADRIDTIINHYKTLVAKIIGNANAPLRSLDFLLTDERDKLLLQWNDTHFELPATRTIHALFEEQVIKSPDTVACIAGLNHVSYSQLNEKANNLATYIAQHFSIKSDQPVGLMIDRSELMLVSILAVLKAGAAYVPIDPNYPRERVTHIISDTGLSLMLANSRYTDVLDVLQWEIPSFEAYVCVDSISELNVETEEEESRMLWDFRARGTTNRFSASGWVSSYTGNVFTGEEMAELVDNVVAKVKPFTGADKRILEIGCGSGLVMFALAPYVARYVGTDISEAVIRQCKDTADKQSVSNVELRCMTALEVDSLSGMSFDLIIVNSVVQYFPSYRYLRVFLEKVTSLLSSTGVLFIGDIRDKVLQDDYYRSLFSGEDNLDRKVSGKRAQENELFIDRRFFDDYFSDYDFQAAVSFSEKIGTIHNELTQFRFDALVHVDKLTPRVGKSLRNKHQVVDYDFNSNSPENLNIAQNNDGLAYILYTSGSTGKPKGVEIRHTSVVNFLTSMKRIIDIDPSDRLLALTTYTFDISVLELFLPLVNGGAVIIPTYEQTYDAEEIKLIVDRQKTTMMQATPTLWKMMFISEWSSRQKMKVLCGGEKLSQELARKLLSCSESLWNMYGPTETTIWSTVQRITDEAFIGIGKPIDNTKIYFVTDGMLMPAGAFGELWIGGAGVAKGYHNLPGLTAERFVASPFVSGDTLYRTGDVGRWLSDGTIQFVGRNDNQIKVRGHRIEPGEIERVLLQLEGIDHAVVMAQEDGEGNNTLVAYFTASTLLAPMDLRAHLYASVPEYMVPSNFVQLSQMPLTYNGKVDRKSLFALNSSGDDDGGRNLLLPRNAVESELSEIWKKILNVDHLSITDNFFERGGHSLKATQLVSRIYKHLNVRIDLGSIFNYPTIQGLSKIVSGKDRKTIRIDPVGEQDSYALSHAQKRLWLLAQYSTDQINYNMPFGYEFKGQVNVAAFNKAMETVVRRHEILRTTFVAHHGEPRQKIHDATLDIFRIDFVDLSSHYDDDNIVKHYLKSAVEMPFDLESGPLFRGSLLKLSDERYLLLFTLHHIICDGWSMDVLANEIATLYQTFSEGRESTLSALRIQYKDYAHWQNEIIAKGEMNDHSAYWLGQFRVPATPLALPYDYDKGKVYGGLGETLYFSLDEDPVKRLNDLGRQHNTGLYVLLMSVYKLLLYRLTGQSDVVIASPVSGRDLEDLEDQIGFYVNTLAFRTQLSGEDTFSEIIARVKSTVLNGLKYQDYPYDVLVENLNRQTGKSTSSLFNVGFTWHLKSDDNKAADFDFEVEKYRLDFNVSKTDLWLHGMYEDGVVFFKIIYNTELFMQETILILIERFKALLQNATVFPEVPVRDLDIRIDAERVDFQNPLNVEFNF